jgi:hypothetical protein
MSTQRTTRVLGVAGSKLTLDGEPFFYQGLTFFNALYNPAFNLAADERRAWVRKFKANGINALRVMCQWDYAAPAAFIDLAPDHSMYTDEGRVKDEPFERLVALVRALDAEGMVLSVIMFAHDKQPYFLPIKAQERATHELTERLKPYGNLFQQIWAEDDREVHRYIAGIRATDADRLLTSAPGFSADPRRPFDHVGEDDEVNQTLDILTPHTLRSSAVPFWYLAPAQVEYLLDTYGKPVIDDSPARRGPVLWGGVPGNTTLGQHLEHIKRDRAIGGYHSYHHDMFQWGYGHELIPPNGIPDPDFSPFHRQVFDYLRDNTRWDVTRR